MGVRKEVGQGIIDVTGYYVDVLDRQAKNAKKNAKKNPELNAFYQGKAEAFHDTMRFLQREIMDVRKMIENEAENS